MRRGREEARAGDSHLQRGLRMRAADAQGTRPDQQNPGRPDSLDPQTHQFARRIAAREGDLLLAGDRVVVTSGRLAGLTGTIAELREGGRVLVALAAAVGGLFLEIDRSWVDATS